MSKKMQKQIAKALARIIVEIVLKHGNKAAKEFEDIYAKEGLKKALDFKNKLEDEHEKANH